MTTERNFSPFHAYNAFGKEAEDRLNMAFPDLSFSEEKQKAQTFGLASALAVGSMVISSCSGGEGDGIINSLGKAWEGVPPIVRTNMAGVLSGAALGVGWEWFDSRNKREARDLEDIGSVTVRQGSNIVEYGTSAIIGAGTGALVENMGEAIVSLDSQRIADILSPLVIYGLWRLMKLTKNPITKDEKEMLLNRHRE